MKLPKFFGRAPDDRPDEPRFDKVMISLKVEEEQVLFILLFEDGTVNRQGDGSVDCTDRDLCIGRTNDGLFRQFMTGVDSALFAQQGAYDFKEKLGKLCELRIIFGLRGSDSMCEGFQFGYGSESQGPPREIGDLVRRAVDLTDPWYEAMRKMASQSGH